MMREGHITQWNMLYTILVSPSFYVHNSVGKLLYGSTGSKCLKLIAENCIVGVGTISNYYVEQIMTCLLGSMGVVLMVLMSMRPMDCGALFHWRW
mmetsp:Transcript_13489/g.20530  ORF Transcript_13489/g.20530 Transcript_13489/m.20530 type:complete len:95 (+) Transcript_13489:284-568(+)